MSIAPSRILVAALALAAACKRDVPAPVTAVPPAAPETSAPAPASPDRFAVDESKLPQISRFTAADVDPQTPACTDLDEHVNAKWKAASEIPSDRTTWGSFEILAERSVALQRMLAEAAAADPAADGVEKIVGDLWATGMDEAAVNAQGIEPIRDRLAAIDALTDAASIAEHLRTTAARGEGFVFGFGSNEDFKDSSMNIAYAFQGGLGLPDKTYYFDADKKPQRDAYLVHVENVLVLGGASAADAEKQAKDVMAFETRLAKVSKSRQEIARDVSLFYNPVTLAEADKLTPGFSWTRFFESQGVAPPERFSLAIPAFHKELAKMLSAVPAAQWKTYLRFHTIDGASPYLSEPFVQEHYSFYGKALRGQKEIKPRWKRVLETIDDQAGEALGQLYVKVAFPPESKARMEKLVANLSDALKVRLENLSWMTPETKQKAMAKWATFKPKIGYPDKWREWTGYVTSRDSYLGNVLAGVEFNYKYDLSKIGKPVDPDEWPWPPQTVNASYNPLRNEINFPAGILQPPFFDPKADDAVNYGGIGAVIGHEMLHGYDDQGSRFGPSGNFENWWSAADAKGFKALTDRLVQQFDAYEALPGKKVNGKLTLGENIADLGGLAVAYDAMKRAAGDTPDPMVEGMSRDQRFFANWATVWRREYTTEELTLRLTTDPHAPARFRAIGAPSNMTAFAEAFGCKPGDAMVRAGAQQIVIW